MKHRILLFVIFFLVSHYAYSQHVANAMPVNIPLNTTKESAVKLLVNKGYELDGSREEDGCKVLKYVRRYYKYDENYGYYQCSDRVSLYCTNGKVSKVSWNIFLFEREILNELKSVYDLEPYAEITGLDAEVYFHWKGNTMIVNALELIILSNTDAEKRYQTKIQERERLYEQHARKEREQKEQQERERRREQERLARERQAEAKRKRVADSIARVEAHLNNLKTSYSSCRFLFMTDDAFVTCISRENPNGTENEIKRLIDDKLNSISKVIVKGNEFKSNYTARNNMLGICNMCSSLKNAEIVDYAERKLQDFVTERRMLNKAYSKEKKTYPNMTCSSFLIFYIMERENK